MPDEEPYARAMRDPELLRSFAAHYDGPLDPLEALRRYAGTEQTCSLDSKSAAALYGRQADDATRDRLSYELTACRVATQEVRAAFELALDAGPAPPSAPEPADPVPDREAKRHPTALVATVLVGGALACGGLGLAIGLGSMAAGATRPAATSAAATAELPKSITFDPRDGQVAFFAVQSAADPRTLTVTVPPVTAGYDLGTACLASVRRPRVVPTETVLLLSSDDRQLQRYVVACDGGERRFYAIAPLFSEKSVHIVIDVDTKSVGAAWVTLNPAGT